MNYDAINEINDLLINEKITLKERHRSFYKIGIERYIVDLIGNRCLYFNNKGDTYITNIILPINDVPEILNLIEINNIITNSNQQKINYLTLLLSLIQAGCCHYEIFLNTGKAFYFGRNGDYFLNIFNLSE